MLIAVENGIWQIHGEGERPRRGCASFVGLFSLGNFESCGISQKGRGVHSFWGVVRMERRLYFDDVAFQADHGGMGPVMGRLSWKRCVLGDRKFVGDLLRPRAVTGT